MVSGGAYGGLWADGDRFSGPAAYLSLTLGRAGRELAAGQCPAVSWPSWVRNNLFYRHLAKARGAGGLSYTSRVCGPVRDDRPIVFCSSSTCIVSHHWRDVAR